MINVSRKDWLKAIRITIVIQVLATVWWAVGPNTLPDMLMDAMLYYDKAIYETLDNISNWLIYIQAIICLLLWSPKKLTAWLYFGSVLLLLIMGMFRGPVAIGELDATISSIQGFAMGALVLLLYQGGLLRISRQESRETSADVVDR